MSALRSGATHFRGGYGNRRIDITLGDGDRSWVLHRNIKFHPLGA